MPVSEARSKIGKREFLRWRIYLAEEVKDEYRREWKTRHREDVMLARLTWEVYVLREVVCNLMSNKKLVIKTKVNDFLIPIATKKTRPKVQMSEEEIVKMHRSWAYRGVGYRPPGSKALPVRNRPPKRGRS